MPTIELNHTVLPARDKWASARWLAEVLGLAEPHAFGPFVVVQVGPTSLDYVDHDTDRHGPIPPLHFAFLIGEDHFDAVHARLVERDIAYFADPGGAIAQDYNTNDGGRGCYFADPDGHWMEVLTVPYGGLGERTPPTGATN